MSVEKKEIKVFVVNYICDKCGAGKMSASPYNDPVWCAAVGKAFGFKHTCDNPKCKFEQNLDRRYPYQVTE